MLETLLRLGIAKQIPNWKQIYWKLKYFEVELELTLIWLRGKSQEL
jgi:hypothetical protein